MITLDKIRLTGLLKENPAIGRVFPFLGQSLLGDSVHHPYITGFEIGLASTRRSDSVVGLSGLVEPKQRSGGSGTANLRKAIFTAEAAHRRYGRSPLTD